MTSWQHLDNRASPVIIKDLTEVSGTVGKRGTDPNLSFGDKLQLTGVGLESVLS